MSLGGEAILGELTPRERDLLNEAWIWRAIQYFAAKGNVTITLSHEMSPVIMTEKQIYRLPLDTQQMLDDARALS